MQTHIPSSLPAPLMQYATMHRDQRNIILHTICVPLMLLAVALLMGSIFEPWMSWTSTLGWALLFCMTFFYIRAAGVLGLATSTLIITLCLISQFFSQWHGFITGGFLLILSYAGHRLGHWYEGNYKKMHWRYSYLFIAPLFATAQMFKRIGFFQNICQEIDSQAGSTYIRDMANEQGCF